MPATLYFDPQSPASNAVKLAIKSLGLKDIEYKALNVHQGETRTPEFIAINPQHTVPTLVDGDHVLWESRAILTYLIESRVPAHRLYPSNPKIKSIINQRLYFDACTIIPRLYEAIMPIYMEKSTEISKEVQEKIYEMFGFLEGFLEKTKWVAGNDVTVADMSIVVSIVGLVEFGVPIEKFPNVKKWLEQCKKLPGFEEYLPTMIGWVDLVKPKLTKGFE